MPSYQGGGDPELLVPKESTALPDKNMILLGKCL